MTTSTPPVMRTVLVACSQEHAFTVFTEQIGRWWPLQSHTVFEESTAGVEFVDGHLVERATDGWTMVLDSLRTSIAAPS